MAGRLDAIWIGTLALSVGLVGIFIAWRSSVRWITSFLVWRKNYHQFHWLLKCFYKSVCVYYLLYLSCLILQAVITVLSTTSSWLFACCCLNMSFKHIPLLKPKTLPAVYADLVNPRISRNISPYFWRCDVFWDLRENACYSCYHTQEQRLFCTGDCWHFQNKADLEIL